MRGLTRLLAVAAALTVPSVATASPVQVAIDTPLRGLPAISASGDSVLMPRARRTRKCVSQYVVEYRMEGKWGDTFLVAPCFPGRSPAKTARTIAKLNAKLKAGDYKSLPRAKRVGSKIRMPGLALTVRGSSTLLAFDVVHKGKPVKVLPVPSAPGTRLYVSGAAYVASPKPHFFVQTRFHMFRGGRVGRPHVAWWPFSIPMRPAAKGEDAEARKIYKQICAACHGASGRGDGVAAAALSPKPRDYKDPAWQKSVTDAYISKVILRGGAAVGRSPTMPPMPHLANKPKVVQALVRLIRSFAGNAGQ